MRVTKLFTRVLALAVGCAALAGCGLTNRDVEPLPEGEAGQAAGAAAEPSPSGGAPSAGSGAAGDASAHEGSGGADRLSVPAQRRRVAKG